MLNIIVSPREITDRGEAYAKRIVRFLKSEKVEYSIYFCKTLNDIKNVAKDVYALGESEFVVIGGDKVLHEFLNSVPINKIKLGIVPTSRKDDFASYIGISSHPIQAMRDILNRDIETVDYLICNNQVVLNNILIGACAEACERFNNYKVKNALSFKLAVLQYGNKFEGVVLNLTSNPNKTKNEVIYDLSISNGGFHKTKNLSPLANVKDGLFNLNYVAVQEDKKKKKQYLRKLLKGNQIYDDSTKQSWINNLHISNPDKLIKACLDGNVQSFEDLNISIVESGLKLYKKLN